MRNPQGAAVDPGTNRLFVADAGNHRVTVYDVATITDGENAVNVLGQTTFTGNGAATAQNRMSYPRSVALAAAPAIVTTSIVYDYDPLYRVTAADYNGGSTYFHYTYDAVGNRLTEVTQAGSTSYGYDIANRLTSVGGVTYTWDNNGNLLSNGASTYTYDHANRLATVTQGGEQLLLRVQWRGGPVAANHQRVADELHGRSRCGPDPSPLRRDEQLPLRPRPHRRGAARRLAVSPGRRPGQREAAGQRRCGGHAGEELRAVRGYAGERGVRGDGVPVCGRGADGTGLTFLRARYYASTVGRFIGEDAWDGDPRAPMSFNMWSYAFANPITRTDPSGLSPQVACQNILIPRLRDLCKLGNGADTDATVLDARYQFFSLLSREGGYLGIFVESYRWASRTLRHFLDASASPYDIGLASDTTFERDYGIARAIRERLPQRASDEPSEIDPLLHKYLRDYAANQVTCGTITILNPVLLRGVDTYLPPGSMPRTRTTRDGGQHLVTSQSTPPTTRPPFPHMIEKVTSLTFLRIITLTIGMSGFPENLHHSDSQ